jgi:hypothetical protein
MCLLLYSCVAPHISPRAIDHPELAPLRDQSERDRPSCTFTLDTQSDLETLKNLETRRTCLDRDEEQAKSDFCAIDSVIEIVVACHDRRGIRLAGLS